jgi:hypothetical protein
VRRCTYKAGRTEEFNKLFQDNMDRGVFWKLTKEEMSAYIGPVNYITMVGAYKIGPFMTTLRICMNSSMKPTTSFLGDP